MPASIRRYSGRWRSAPSDMPARQSPASSPKRGPSPRTAAELVRVDWRPQSPSEPQLVWHGTFGEGDFAAALSPGTRVIDERFSFARQTGAPLEPRGIIASFDPAERLLTLHHSHQVPHEMQGLFASALNLPGHRIRLTCPDVGGGFGIKLHFYADEVATAAIAMQLDMPVKYVADRAESFVTDVHAREHIVRARLAVTPDGTIRQWRSTIVF